MAGWLPISKGWQGPHLREKLSSKSAMPSEESSFSWYWRPQWPGASKQRVSIAEGLEKGERKGKGMGNESYEVNQDKRLKLTSCDIELSPGARNSRDSEGQRGMMGIFIPKTCVLLLWEQAACPKRSSFLNMWNLKNLQNTLERQQYWINESVVLYKYWLWETLK